MSKITANCIEYLDKRTLCTAKENGKSYVIENLSLYDVQKVKVDGCLQVDVGMEKCDYLFSVSNEGMSRVFFVELKGGDTVKGMSQILRTIVYLEEEFAGYKKEARVVGSRSLPDFKSVPTYKSLFKRINTTGGKIILATNKYYKESI